MTRLRLSRCLFGSLVAPLAALAADPVGRAFTYQGELVLNGAPVADLSDFQFTLWDAAVGGNQIGLMQEFSAAPGDGGRFVAMLNDLNQFGNDAFIGEARFLEIAVRSPSGVGAFTTLTPRQELTGAPYAIGLSLPFIGRSDATDNLFRIVSTGQFSAGEFAIMNPASVTPALMASSDGQGPAGYFVNLAGETAFAARAMQAGTAVYADTQGLGADATAIHGIVLEPAGGPDSVAVYGENRANHNRSIGVRGDTVIGRGVQGAAASAGHGVYGESQGGTGVYGEQLSQLGNGPGVHGVTRSVRDMSAGVLGESTGIGSQASTYGVLGRSLSQLGVGVRGEGNVGVDGQGTVAGVYGIATQIPGAGVRGEGMFGVSGQANTGVFGSSGVVGYAAPGEVNSIGVLAYGSNVFNSTAIRAENSSGDGVTVFANRGVIIEGSQTGVYSYTASASGVAGVFENWDGGVALRTDGLTELNGNTSVTGTMSVNVLEILGGADLAERFAFREPAEPGMVVEIDPAHPGELRVSRSAYNARVAGVISGANDLAAGVVLGERPTGDNELPVALTGRVWVYCDTRERGVQPGDLLTTSDLPGYAMVASDPARAMGAVIGKAMSSLEQGESGMVLVLVNLQ